MSNNEKGIPRRIVETAAVVGGASVILGVAGFLIGGPIGAVGGAKIGALIGGSAAAGGECIG